MEPTNLLKHLDEFGENRLISRLNRKFSDLLHLIFRIPKSWTENPSANFNKHLSRINNSALTVLFFAGIVAGILCMAMALQQDSSVLFFVGIGMIPGAFLMQFVLGLFCSANLKLTFGPSILLVSRLIPEVFAVVGVLNFIYALVMGILAAIAGFSLSLISGLTATGIALCVMVVTGYISWTATNCEKLLTISIDEEGKQGPAEYLFSLLLFFGRYFLALVPIYFAASVFLLSAGVIYFGILQFGNASSALVLGEKIIEEMFSAPLTVLFAGLFPIFAHFIYLIYLAFADVGIAFFRLVRNTEKVATLSEEAMDLTPEEAKTS